MDRPTRSAMHAYNRTEVSSDSEEIRDSASLSWDSSSYSRYVQPNLPNEVIPKRFTLGPF